MIPIRWQRWLAEHLELQVLRDEVRSREGPFEASPLYCVKMVELKRPPKTECGE